MSDVSHEGGFPATLDLSSADLKGFDPIPAAAYDCIVERVEAIEAENPEGKLPLGTPGINVMFSVDGGPYNNRKVFNRYWMPGTEGYDPDKRAKLLGMVARFLMAVGYPEEVVTAPGFSLDLNDIVGRTCKVGVKVDTEYNNNKVTFVKPRDAGGNSTAGAGLL